MRILSAICIGLFLFGIQVSSLRAQVHDGVLWAGVSLEKKVVKHLKIKVKNQVRFNNNFSNFRSELTQVGLTYRLNKRMDLTAGYRFSYRPDGNNHRMYADWEYGRKFKGTRFSWEARLRLQRDFGTTDLPEQLIRPRFRVKYNIKGLPLNPFAGVELFYSFNNIEQQFSQYRLQAGLSYKLNKKFSLKGAYYYQPELNRGIPEIAHIWIFGLGVDLDKLFKGLRK